MCEIKSNQNGVSVCVVSPRQLQPICAESTGPIQSMHCDRDIACWQSCNFPYKVRAPLLD